MIFVKSGMTNDVLISTDLFRMLQCCLLCPTHESIMLPVVAGCAQSYVGTNVSRSNHYRTATLNIFLLIVSKHYNGERIQNADSADGNDCWYPVVDMKKMPKST